MRLRSFAFAAAVLVLTASGALAQNSAISLLSTSCIAQTCTFSVKFDDIRDGGAVETGGPYSGWESLESVDTLGNGTHRTLQGKNPMVFRDSSGRVRLEYQYPQITGPAGFTGGPYRVSVVEIRDPVAGYRYILDAANHVAHRQPYHTKSVFSLPNTSIIARSASAATTENLAFGVATTVGLGTRDISGVTAYGVRQTRVSPPGPGRAGREMTDVNEYWMDPRTDAELLSTDSGSNGVMTRTMNDYKTSPPDPALFQIPQGYRIVDETGSFDIVQPNPNGRPMSLEAAPGLREPLGFSSTCDDKACTITYNPSPRPEFFIVNAPWSGREKTESTGRTERDGTKLPDNSGFGRTMYRDSQGRLRTDPVARMGPGRSGTPVVFTQIQDPVAAYYYLLDPVNRVAHRLKASFQPEPVRKGAFANGPGTVTARDGSVITNEDLARKEIFGVDAVGFRQTRATPAGVNGYDKPTVNVNETWTDSNTGVVLITKNTRPEGENMRTIPDYKDAEPDPAVFQVPAGYKIVDETGKFSFTVPIQK